MRALRHWIKGLLSGLRVRVTHGPLQGYRLGLMCGMRFVRGRYDPSAVHALQTLIKPGDTVYDIGAHVGYLSLVAARVVGERGRVIAFEPSSLNLRYLRGHVRANDVRNVDIVAACVMDRGGMVSFDAGKGSGRGRVVNTRGAGLRAVALDEEIAARRLPPPQFLKVDVEGAELLLLRGARQMLRTHRPIVLLSVHSEALKRECSALLAECGYEVDVGAKPGELLARPRAALSALAA